VHAVFECYALSVHYGQRHSAETRGRPAGCAGFGCSRTSNHGGGPRRLIGGSALTDTGIAIPESGSTGIPITYVPARNHAGCCRSRWVWAEIVGARRYFRGCECRRLFGLPGLPAGNSSRRSRIWRDSRPRRASRGVPFKIQAPLIDMSKADIIRNGYESSA